MGSGYWEMLSQDILPQAATDRGFALSAVISHLGCLIARHTIIVPIAAQEWTVMEMTDTLELIASIEWIALGVLVFWRLRHLNKRMSQVLDEIEELYKDA